MTVEEILELLRSRKADYEDPGAYLDEMWYIKCAAKVDVLDDVIDTIEYRMKEAK
jgi:hypothetical protein